MNLFASGDNLRDQLERDRDRFADLHLHTVFSDGTYTPEQLVKEALRQGLSAVSVVDHDTIDGIDSMIQLGQGVGLENLPGIELTAEYDGIEIHILGYLIDYKNQALNDKLSFLKSNRVERIYKIVGKLQGLGVKLEAEEVFNLSKNGTVGRLHVARAMARAGAVDNIYEAFRKYIGDKGPAYVCGFRFDPDSAIKLIRQAGGIPVLAHPYIMNRDDLIPKFVEHGLMGIEVYYSEHTQSMVNFYLRLAKKYNLLVTGGSDCHGNAKPEVKIGSIKIPYDLVEKLKEAKNRQ